MHLAIYSRGLFQVHPGVNEHSFEKWPTQFDDEWKSGDVYTKVLVYQRLTTYFPLPSGYFNRAMENPLSMEVWMEHHL